VLGYLLEFRPIVRRILYEGMGKILVTCRKSSLRLTSCCTTDCQHMKPCNISKQMGTPFSGVECPLLEKTDSWDIGNQDLQKIGTERGKTHM